MVSNLCQEALEVQARGQLEKIELEGELNMLGFVALLLRYIASTKKHDTLWRKTFDSIPPRYPLP